MAEYKKIVTWETDFVYVYDRTNTILFRHSHDKANPEWHVWLYGEWRGKWVRCDCPFGESEYSVT